MSNSDAVEDILNEVDTNRDGVIDKMELRNWTSKDERLTSSPYESSTYGYDRNGNTRSPRDRYGYKETTRVTCNQTDDRCIRSSGQEETMRVIKNLGSSVYVVDRPEITRPSSFDRPVRREQRVLLKCLQPPPLPPPEPLTIIERRPEQPPTPPPVVICEQSPSGSAPPPLYLCERPPIPPPCHPGGTMVRWLPRVPVPPRSLIIKRFPPGPDKPRDIIIERWIPYGPQPKPPERIVPAPPPKIYPRPTHTIVVYDNVRSNIVQKFERLGIERKDPAAYRAPDGSPLLDPVTLEQQARNAGVTEDISCGPLRYQPGYPPQSEPYPKRCCCGCNGTFADTPRHTRFGYNVDDPSDISANI